MASTIFEIGFNRNQKNVKRLQLESDGNIPKWIEGSFIRNGPGLFYIGNKRLNHWFDGLAKLHKFDISGGKVWYENHFLECEASKQALSSNKLTYSEFATDPCWGIFGKLKSLFRTGPTDSAKVNLAKVRDKYFALGETTMQLEFDPETLKTIGKFNFDQPKFGTSTTAHPHQEGEKTFNLITKYGPINKYSILSMESDPEEVTSVNTFSPSYMHSFGMSNRYYIIIESPFSVFSLKLMYANKPFIKNFKWAKNKKNKIWIIDKKSGDVVLKKNTDPFFFFHFVNSFEKDNQLSFDIVTYPNADIITSYYLENLEKGKQNIPGGKLTRFNVDLSTHEISKEVISEARIELPQMDYDRYAMKSSYNFIYAMGLQNEQSEFYDQITKIDIAARKYITWSEENCYPGEPIFIPTPNSNNEDEGVLLSLVIDTNRDSSFLLFLDSREMKEITRIYTPDPIMVGFHGNFFNRKIS